MTDITITLTDTQYSALSYVSNSPEEWVENAVTARANVAIDEIVQLTVKYCLNSGISIPNTTDEIVALAFAEGVVKTVVQKNAEAVTN